MQGAGKEAHHFMQDGFARRKGKAMARPLADFAQKALSPAAALLGFGESDIILHWRDIAGGRLAEVSEPERLKWPVQPRNRPPGVAAEPAALVLRVESAFAIEAQHLAPVLMERINARLGWRCVGRILIRQGPVRRRAAGRGRVPPPSAEAVGAAEQATQGIESDRLRQALIRLGARALDKPGKTRTDGPSGA